MKTVLVLQELANLSTLELITNDGSPSSRKLFVLWNPTSKNVDDLCFHYNRDSKYIVRYRILGTNTARFQVLNKNQSEIKDASNDANKSSRSDD